jgi:hypothetical protein
MLSWQHFKVKLVLKIRFSKMDETLLYRQLFSKNQPVGRASVPANQRRPGTAAPPTRLIFIFDCNR